jgi:PAN domain
MAVLLLVGWAGYRFVHPTRIYLEESFRAVQQLVDEAVKERERQARVAAEAEEKRKADEDERQSLAAKAEQERQARATAEAEAKGNALFTIRRGMEAVFSDLEPVHAVKDRVLLDLSFEECQEKCQATTCGVFTWRISTRVCYLYIRGYLKPNFDFVSGVRN